jgi:hypothetical protein
VALQPQGFFVEYLPATTGDRGSSVTDARDSELNAHHRHVFCGAHDVAGAECPNCAKPLMRFLGLATDDPRLGLLGAPFATLSLFYCWRCPISSGMFFYWVRDDGSVSLVQYEEGRPEVDFPYEAYPDHFPAASARLVRVSTEDQALLKSVNAGACDEAKLQRNRPELIVPRHQYGGEPLLVQRDTGYQVACPGCRSPMPFLASIGDACLDPRGFVGNEFVQVLYHYCRECQVIGAFHRCD